MPRPWPKTVFTLGLNSATRPQMTLKQPASNSTEPAKTLHPDGRAIRSWFTSICSAPLLCSFGAKLFIRRRRAHQLQAASPGTRPKRAEPESPQDRGHASGDGTGGGCIHEDAGRVERIEQQDDPEQRADHADDRGAPPSTGDS